MLPAFFAARKNVHDAQTDETYRLILGFCLAITSICRII